MKFVLFLAVLVAAATAAKCPARNAACMNARNFARCRKLRRQGCRNIRIQESCPMRFSCGDALPAPAPVALPTPDVCPARNSTCMTDKIYDDCQALAKQGCTSFIFLTSCPYAGVGCANLMPMAPSPPTLAPVRQEPCPPRTNACMTDANHAHCLALVAAGCKEPFMSKSCPVQFSCGNITVPKPDACPPRTNACMTDANHAHCLALVAAGCKEPFMSRSCPVQFSCGNITVPKPDPCPARNSTCMTDKIYDQCQALARQGCQSFIFLTSCPYAGVGCGDSLPPTTPICPAANSSCMNQERYAQCQKLVTNGCQNILTLESCPLQFACGK